MFMIPQVDSIKKYDQFNPLGRTDFERNLPNDPLRKTESLFTQAREHREELTSIRRHQEIINLYNGQGQIETNAPTKGTNVDSRS
jgi:hypothetical protein